MNERDLLFSCIDLIKRMINEPGMEAYHYTATSYLKSYEMIRSKFSYEEALALRPTRMILEFDYSKEGFLHEETGSSESTDL